MKKRARKVLSLLLKSSDYVTAKELAESLSTSRRGIMYSIDMLDDELAAAGLSITERVTNKGIRIVPEELGRVGSYLESGVDDELLDFTDAHDRRFFLLFSFLCIGVGVTVESLSEQMGTSTRTVSHEIGALRALLQRQNLEIVYEKKDGYRIDGNVFTIRNLFSQLMAPACPTEGPAELAASFAGLYELAGRTPEPALSAEKLGEIGRMLSDMIPAHYTGKANRVIFQHLAIALACCSQESRLEFSNADKAFLKRSVSYDIARVIRLKAQEIAGVSLNECEDCYIAALLQSFPTRTATNDAQNYPFEIEVLVQNLILNVGETYQYDFNGDPDLFEDIVGHVIPLVYRVLFNSQNTNPLLGEIVEKYARLNMAVREALAGIETYAGAAITDDECSLLTLYFASSIEKMSNESDDKARVIVVCNEGNAVSRLLQYKLINAFNVDVIAAVAGSDVYRTVEENRPIDLVVSVIELDQSRLSSVQFLKVTPLLSDSDFDQLSRKLRQRTFLAPEPEEHGASLVDLLAPSCFEVLPQASDMDSLIEAGGRLLYCAGLCDEEYPAQMVAAAHCFGPLTTILIAPGIIMPHAGISEHVHRTGFSFVRIRKPVTVNGKEVTCALSLCTRNKRINQRAIQQFGILLGRTSFMKRVNDVETHGELVSLIEDCLKEAERK